MEKDGLHRLTHYANQLGQSLWSKPGLNASPQSTTMI